MQHPWELLLNRLGGVEALEGEAVEKILEAKGGPLAVACSGGPDSVAAALVTRALHGGHLTLLHFNHALRGEASDGDEAFVRDLAKELGAEFRSGRWETPDSKNETAAREGRMEFLHRYEYPLISFGHHADDAAETLLMRLARGANLQGLTAPHPVSRVGGHLHARPLLKLRKAKIMEALDGLKIAYRTDATNAQNDYLRNKIRNELLPFWQSLESRDVVEGLLASQRQLNKMLPLWRENFNPQERAQKEQKKAERAEEFRAHLPLGTTLYLPDGCTLSARIVEILPAQAKARSHPQSVVYIHTQMAQGGCLNVRNWREGERYRPLGTGSRKIKELLNENAKDFPASARRSWPVVMDGRGVWPLWLPCCRITQQAALPEEATHAIELRFCPQGTTLTDDDS